MPGVAHCCSWITAALMEALIVAVMPHMQPWLRVSGELLTTLSALGLTRVGLLALMVATFILGHYRLKAGQTDSGPEERQSLLQNGHSSGPNYDSMRPKADIASGASQRTQVSGTGWLDYIAGFKILFPYLW